MPKFLYIVSRYLIRTLTALLWFVSSVLQNFLPDVLHFFANWQQFDEPATFHGENAATQGMQAALYEVAYFSEILTKCGAHSGKEVVHMRSILSAILTIFCCILFDEYCTNLCEDNQEEMRSLT